MMRHLPNILSVSRIAALPVLAWVLVYAYEHAFVWLIVCCLITDILDGFLARRFGWATALGARLDSIADLGVFACAVGGLFVFQWAFVQTHAVVLIFIVGLYLLSPLVTLVRFRKWPSYHLWSAKITAYLQGLFFVLLFARVLPHWYFLVVIIVTSCAYLEEFFVALKTDRYRSDVKTGFHLLKTKQDD
ncbi:MAG: CDP-alcohol phosphatidyltransferase family protein [Bacteroidia bacterium]